MSDPRPTYDPMDIPEMIKRLKPCPFCGNEATIFPGQDYGCNHWIRCTYCFCTFPDEAIIEDLAKAWNRRAT